MGPTLENDQVTKLRRFLTDEIISIRARQGAEPRDWARPLAVLLLLETGARTMEILGQSLELNGPYWKSGVGGVRLIRGLKGSNDRTNVPISKLCFECLVELAGKPLVTYTSAQWLRVYFAKVTVKLFQMRTNIHSLRHNYCINAEKTLGLKGAMAAVGHKSPSTLLLYLNQQDAEDCMKKVFRAVG